MVTVETPKKLSICVDPKDVTKQSSENIFPWRRLKKSYKACLEQRCFKNLMRLQVTGSWNLTKKAPSCARSTLHLDVIASFVFHLAVSRQAKYFSKWCLRWSKTLMEVKPSWTIQWCGEKTKQNTICDWSRSWTVWRIRSTISMRVDCDHLSSDCDEEPWIRTVKCCLISIIFL